MLESGAASAPRSGGGAAGSRGAKAAGGSAKPAAWVICTRPTAPGPSAAFTRSRISGSSICTCGPCAPCDAERQQPARRARASGVSLTGRATAAISGPAISDQSAFSRASA